MGKDEITNSFDKIIAHDDYLVKQLEAKMSEDVSPSSSSSFIQTAETYRPRREEEEEEEEGQEEQKEEDVCMIKKKEGYTIIKKNNLQVWVERKRMCNTEMNHLFSTDNVLMIKGRGLCLIFNKEMEKFLKDHAVAVKSNYYTSHYYDKPGRQKIITYSKSFSFLNIIKKFKLKRFSNKDIYRKTLKWFFDR